MPQFYFYRATLLLRKIAGRQNAELSSNDDRRHMFLAKVFSHYAVVPQQKKVTDVVSSSSRVLDVNLSDDNDDDHDDDSLPGRAR